MIFNFRGLKLVHCKGTSYTAAVGCGILWFFESLTFIEGGLGYRICTEHRLAFGIWYCLRKLVFYLHQSSFKLRLLSFQGMWYVKSSLLTLIDTWSCRHRKLKSLLRLGFAFFSPQHKFNNMF